MTETTSIRGQEFILHPTGAVFWKEKSALLIADVHFGKIAHFRKHGIALPPMAAQKNIQELKAVADYFRPARIYFLGDLFHSTKNSEWRLFEDWHRHCGSAVFLITGNHDIIHRQNYDDLGICVSGELVDDGFLFSHFPREQADLFTICGHLHPGVRLQGPGKQILSLPCFHKSDRQFMLPAFGAFTGKCLIRAMEGDEVYVIAQESVVRVADCRA